MNKERIPGGDNEGLAPRKITGIDGLTEHTDFGKTYLNKMGEMVMNAVNYYGDGEVLYDYDEYSERISKSMLKRMGKPCINHQNTLINALSKNYSQRNGKSICPMLENAEEEYSYDDSVDYIDYAVKWASDEEFYGFKNWYKYALGRYAREQFLPRARALEKKYISKIQTLVDDGLLPAEMTWKIQQFKNTPLNYIVMDYFREGESGGECGYDGDETEIKYLINHGVGDSQIDGWSDNRYYRPEGTDFENILFHEFTHRIVVQPFDVHLLKNNSRHNLEYLQSIANESNNEYDENMILLDEAGRIMNEATTDWLTGIMIDAKNIESPAKDDGEVYRAEKKVLDYLLNEGDQKIEPATWFSLCQDNIEDKYEDRKGRKIVMDVLFKAFPDCKTELDIAKLVVERFNWYEYQEEQKRKRRRKRRQLLVFASR